jgi:hypothetical protein
MLADHATWNAELDSGKELIHQTVASVVLIHHSSQMSL